MSGTDRRYPLADGMHLTIGRLQRMRDLLDDQAVSRRHCTIEATGSGVMVTDLDSVNGTFVNERPDPAPARRCLATPSAVGLRRSSAVTSRVRRRRRTRPVSMLRNDDDTLDSVISKRFEPARFDWLSTLSSSADTGILELGLLQRAQRHLSMLHRVSEVLGLGARSAGLADATLGTILDVTGGDRAAFVLRRTIRIRGGAEVAAARGRERQRRGRSRSAGRWSPTSSRRASRPSRYDAVNDDRFSKPARASSGSRCDR